MKTQRNHRLIKTDHFLLRAWERGYYHSSIEKLIHKIRACNKKAFYLISNKTLKKLNVKKTKSKYLVIVVKENCLVTLFELDDLYQFLKVNSQHQIETIK